MQAWLTILPSKFDLDANCKSDEDLSGLITPDGFKSLPTNRNHRNFSARQFYHLQRKKNFSKTFVHKLVFDHSERVEKYESDILSAEQYELW
jgi:hypothetical protein